MKVWAWSFACLLSGTYPSADADGKPFPPGSRRFKLAGHAIAGSWRFAFAGALGDWSWHAKLFYPVLHGASHNFLCFRCCASRKLRRLRHQDRRPAAGWRRTVISTVDFLDAMPLICNAVYTIAGFDLALIRCDLMHCCFLGMFQVTRANMIVELMELNHFCSPGTTKDLLYQFTYCALVSYCRSFGLKIDMRSMTPGTLGVSKLKLSPELNCKAHDCRVIVGWIEGECSRASDRNTPHGAHRHALAWSQLQLCLALERAPRYLVHQEDLDNIQKAGGDFVDLYVSLSEKARENGVNRWKLLRKVHTFIHQLEDMLADRLNPRHYSGWTDESLMNRVVKMATDVDSRTALLNVLVGWWPAFIERARTS